MNQEQKVYFVGNEDLDGLTEKMTLSSLRTAGNDVDVHKCPKRAFEKMMIAKKRYQEDLAIYAIEDDELSYPLVWPDDDINIMIMSWNINIKRFDGIDFPL